MAMGLRVTGYAFHAPITVLTLLMLAACDDATAPTTESITLDICDGSHWIAYQNDGARWTLLGQGDGVYTFAATRRLGIARARFQAHASMITVDYLTPEQAVEKLGCAPGAALPGGPLSGSIAGLTGFQWATVYFNGIGTYLPPGSDSWQMPAQPIPATLLAARYDSAAGLANRIIIRRDRAYASGTTVPLLDFDSDEGFAPQVNTLSFTGPHALASVWYLTRGWEHALSSVPMGPLGDEVIPRTAVLYSLPAARQVPGDIHVLNLQSDSRVAQHYFREASDRALTLGPPLAAPTFTTVATDPYRRARAELPWQPEYGQAVSINMAQLTATRSSRVTLNATREYFGEAPAVWSLTLPDFSRVAGFQLDGAFAEGEFSWSATATGRRFGLSPANAHDGETALFASRQGTSP